MNDAIRSFISIEIDANSKASLVKLTKQLKQKPGLNDPENIKWMSADKLHLTLLFLGDQHPDKLQALGKLLQTELQAIKIKPFSLALNSINGFPKSKASILAVVMECSGVLMSLYECVARCARQLDISYDEKKFKPHITLGRLKRKQQIDAGCDIDLTLMVSKIQLMQSQLNHEGSIYRSLLDIEL